MPIFLTAIAFAFVALAAYSASTQRASYVAPILFLLVGVAGLLFVLLYYATSLSEWNLTDHPEALALPSGSIRAVLAISLIVVLMVFGSFMFFETGSNFVPVGDKQSVEAGQVAELRRALPQGVILVETKSTDAGRATVEYYARRDESGRLDIAKQLLTMIATALTTLIGFYFGSRTAEERIKPEADTARSQNLLSPMGPALDRANLEQEIRDLARQAENQIKAAEGSGDQDRKDSAMAARTALAELQATVKAALAKIDEGGIVARDFPRDHERLAKAAAETRNAVAEIEKARKRLSIFVEEAEAAGTDRPLPTL